MRDGPLLDVGCGLGVFSLEAKKAGMWVQSVDSITQRVMRLADKVDETEVASVDYLETQRKYDRVICFDALERAEKPLNAFENLCRSTGSKGKMTIRVPVSSLFNRFRKLASLLLGKAFSLFSDSVLIEKAENQGFKLNQAIKSSHGYLILSFQRER